jgi:signal transduction histidine kinase
MISLYSGRIEDSDILKRLVAWCHRGSVRFSEVYRQVAHLFESHTLEPRKLNDTVTALAHRPNSLEALAIEILHEVRNPLGSITLYASLIQEQPAGETARWANEILRASRRLQTTISQLVSFATETQLAAEWLPVSTLLQEVTDATFPVLHSGRWALATELQEDLPPLWGDRTLLTQALTNLIVNATEAMPQGGTVRIHAYQAVSHSSPMQGQRTVAIQVEDEGIGIALHDREKVFTPFFTTKPSGTGVGLALTQRIIHAHHGMITISDAPVCGCCMTVFLPAGETRPPVYALTGSVQWLMHDKARESV